MKALATEIAMANQLVANWKPCPYLRLQVFITRLALRQAYVYPGDVPEDLCARDDRQGVASNVWNNLESLEIIERLPLNFQDAPAEIFGGRKRNRNPSAKGRWTSVYRLYSSAKASEWLRRNEGLSGQPDARVEPVATVQQEFAEVVAK
jgi:hypothetical protein